MATTNSQGLSASDFLVAEDSDQPSTWHLQVKQGGKPSHSHMAGAFAALTSNFRGHAYAGPNKSDALAKLHALYSSEGMPWPGDKKQADDPGSGDVHVDVPVNSERPARSHPALTKLVKRLRKRFAGQLSISAADFESDYRSAVGHSGGLARARRRRQLADSTGDWEVCAACLKGDFADCICPACQEGDPADCLCALLLEEGMGGGDGDGDEDDQPKPGSQGMPATMTEGSPHLQTPLGNLRLFFPVALAEAPEWINYLPKPGTYKHPRYGDLDFSAKRNVDFVQKYNAGVYQRDIPIDGEHETKISGAMGWLKQLRVNGDGSVDARIEWTDRGRGMLAENRYKYFSPEWFDQWRDPLSGEVHQNVIIGGALTTRPFLKESGLRPLVASEAGIFCLPNDDGTIFPPIGSGTERPSLKEAPIMADDGQTQNNDPMAKKLTEVEAALAKANEKAKKAREDAEKAATESKQLTEKLAEEAKAASEEAKAAKEEAKAAIERIAALETESQRRQLAEIARGFHGDVNEHIAFMEGLGEAQRTFYVTQQKAHAEQLRASKVFSVAGVAGDATGDSALSKLRAASEEIRSANSGMSAPKAFAEAMRAHPDLYEEYLKETAV